MLTTLSHRFLLGTSALAVVLMASPYGTHATGTEAGRDAGGAVLRTSQRIDGRVASAGVAGACCQADGTCTLTTAAACGGVGGGFLGEGTVCLNDGDGDGRDDACPCVLASDCNDGNVCT
ncbi:MAG: hypothetical protein ACE5EX_08355, partial [Phycisphaerae bacterium]